MGNYIKYSTNAQTNALKIGNFWLGPTNDGKGPTSSTGYYTAFNPTTGTFVVYQNKASNGPAIYSASNQSELVSITNKIAGTSFTTSAQCLTYYVTQTDKFCVNRQYEDIITNGLTLNVDAGFTPSYPTSGTSWYDISGNNRNGTLTNGPTFSSNNGGSIVFDGVDDSVNFGSLGALTTQGTIQFWMYSTAVENFRNPLTTGPINGSGGSTGNRAIRFEQYTSNTPYGGFDVIIGNDTASGINGYTSFDYSPSAPLSQNTWYHVSLTWNQSTSNVTGHLNGIQRFNQSCTTFPSTISSFYVGVGWETSRYFKGNIPIVLLYNRALSDIEVLQNYKAQKARFGL